MDYAVGILRGLLGVAVLLATCFLLSNNRKAISWRLVGGGLLLQLVLAVLILSEKLSIEIGGVVLSFSNFFDWISKGFVSFLKFSEAGAVFMFGGLITDMNTFGYIFAFQVLPTIVFFSAVSSILYYYGILQAIIKVAAKLMMKLMGLSGAESLAAAANVFIGQTEAPLVVKPYIENMSKSEILCLMVGGMATIAGGVFAAYIGFLGGTDEATQQYFAKHLLTASIISAPAAIVAAKMLYPETREKSLDNQLKMSGDVGNNLLDAISRGTTDGLKLAVNVGVMLLVFTALIALVNAGFLSGTDAINTIANAISGSESDWNENIKIATGNRFEGFTFTYLLGLIFAPVAWILGTPYTDITTIGQLLGQKTVINEFVAYAEFNSIREAAIVPLQNKSVIIATYALCGFSNFASIGIQIGGIGAIAPGQRKNLTELGIKSLIGGTIACFLTAAIAGMFVI